MKKIKKEQWLGQGVLFVLFALFFLYLGKEAKTPLIYPDEAGYIGWARLIAGKTGDGFHYSPGYSLLLSPIFFFTDDITKAYPVIIRLNALIGALIPVLLYRLSGVWCRREAVLERMCLAAVASLYPSVTAYSQLALCENFLCVLLLGITLCFCALWENRNRVGIWLLVAVLCVWATLTHARGITFGMGALVTAAFLWRDKKKVLIGGGVVGAGLLAAVCAWLLSNPTHVGAVHMLNQFRHLLQPSGIGAFFGTLASHFCYALWSTYGMIGVALWYGIRAVRKKEQGWGVWVFLLSSFFFLWCLSAFYMSHHEKAIHILYGRYLDVAVPLLLLGLFYGWSKRRKIPWWVWAICAGAVVLTGGLYAQQTIGLDGGIMNSVGIFLYRSVLRFFRFWWAAAFFAVVTAAVFLVGRRHRSFSIWVLCAIFVFQAFSMKISYFDPEAYGKKQVPQVIGQLPQGAEIYVADSQTSYTWQYYNYPIHRPDLVMEKEDRGQPFVLSRQLRTDGTLMAIEKNAPIYLYSRQEGAEGLDYPGELTEYKTAYQWKSTGEGAEVTVINQGSPWLCFNAVKDVRNGVRLGVRQFDKDQKLIADQRYDLSDNMYRGDQQTFSLSFSEDCVYAEIQPVMEFTAWFSQRGDTPLLLRRQEKGWVEMIGKGPESDHSFRRVEFSHLRYVNSVDNTSCAGNLEGFYANDTGAEAVIRNIKMPGGTGVLVIETGEEEQSNVSVTLNETVTVPAQKYEEGAYYFPFRDIPEITSIAIKTDTVNPFRESGLPGWMSFLSLDSNLRPVQWSVHRLEDILGRSVNNHEFGLGIQTIEVILEEDAGNEQPAA